MKKDRVNVGPFPPFFGFFSYDFTVSAIPPFARAFYFRYFDQRPLSTGCLLLITMINSNKRS